MALPLLATEGKPFVYCHCFHHVAGVGKESPDSEQVGQHTCECKKRSWNLSVAMSQRESGGNVAALRNRLQAAEAKK